jgi:hypothetical protein
MSADIAYRQRRYLISMGIRVVAFLLAVFLFAGVWRFVAAFVALVVPYFAVVFANGGREPDSTASFESFNPHDREEGDLLGPVGPGIGEGPSIGAPGAAPGAAQPGEAPEAAGRGG